MVQVIHISDLHLISPGFANALRGFVFGNLYRLRHYYTFADRNIRPILPGELTRIAASQPTALALTGDIVAWPGDSESTIDQEYYPYLESLRKAVKPIPGLPPLFILGNHDWGDSIARLSFARPFNHVTNFTNTQFQKDPDYRIVEPRAYSVQTDSVTIIFFLIDSNQEIVPATGEVKPDTINFLQEKFQDGKAGKLPGLSQTDYDQAVKIMLLHHSPLPEVAYAGALSQADYKRLELAKAKDFLEFCKDDVDVFLCGHTHVFTKEPYEGFVVVDSGTTLATTSVVSPPPLSLNLLRIPNRNTIEVESFFFTYGIFSPHGSKTVTFNRGQAPLGVLGRGRWA